MDAYFANHAGSARGRLIRPAISARVLHGKYGERRSDALKIDSSTLERHVTELNPYESPNSAGELTDEAGRRQRTWWQLFVPAVAFISLGIVHIAIAIVQVVLFVYVTVFEEREALFFAFIFAFSAILVTNIAWAGVRMLQLRELRYVQMMSVCAIVPLCSPLFVFGIPFAIWALIVLSFQRNQDEFLEIAELRQQVVKA